jgi:hypothetical protein
MYISREMFNHIASVIHFTATENARLVMLFKEHIQMNSDPQLLTTQIVNSFTFSHMADIILQSLSISEQFQPSIPQSQPPPPQHS